MISEAVERKKVPLCPILIGLFLFFAATAYGQTVDCENNCNLPECNFPANVEKGCRCFDGIDNDPIAGQPNRFDRADPNCATYYGLTFVGEGSQCDINVPIVGSPFDLVGPPAVSGQNTADTQSKVAVGDVDGDGIPDVVITSKWNSEVRVVATTDNQVIDGADAGDIKADFNLDGKLNAYFAANAGGCELQNLLFEHEVLIADIDQTLVGGRKRAEIFAVVSNRKGSPKSPPSCFFLMGFRYSPGGDGLQPMYQAVNLGINRPGTFGIADMDGDGKAEVYMRDRIYAAETGALLAAGNGNWDLDITSGPVAVNISGDAKMELVCGTKIFAIPSLTNRTPGSPGALTLLHDMNTITANKAFVKLMLDPVEYGEDTHSMCSVADLDNDGKMDVVISGALGSPSGKTAVFYWNVADGTVTHYIVADPVYADGWPWGTSRVNLGDVTGDGVVELSFIAGTQLFCLKADTTSNALSSLWASPRIVNDSRSGVLTVTLYDFNNDGKAEMVYRDSQELVIIDGETGTQKLWSATCQSHTYTEGPVIADANGDGGTDICVACNRNNSFNINADIQQQALGEVRMFYSSGNEWLPTRKVWNQPGYFVVNINDDLSLPFPQFDGTTVFSGQCHPGQSEARPFNVFLNQVPFITADGCPFVPQPDLAFYGDDPAAGTDTNGDGVYQPFVEVEPPFCGSRNVRVTFHISNEGYLPINASVPVAFYNGDPRPPNGTGTFLYTTNLPINLPVGANTTAVATFNGPVEQFNLYIVLNNSGNKNDIIPTATDCRLANNIQTAVVTPKLFTVAAAKVQDNITCSPLDAIGEAEVTSISNGATVITDWSRYEFQWYDGAAAGPLTIKPGEINYNLEGLIAGTYSVTVRSKDAPHTYCTSAPQEVVIGETSLLPSFTLDSIPQTSCDPLNGGVIANFGGKSIAGYTLVWTDDLSNTPVVVPGATTPTLAGLSAGVYRLTATNGTCEYTDAIVVPGPLYPEGQALLLEPVHNCINPSSGKITARPYSYNTNPPTLISDADTVNYSFAWYRYDTTAAEGSRRGSMLAPGAALTVPTRDVPEGVYEVVILDKVTKCHSENLMTVPVPNVLTIPTADIEVVANQTSCDPNNPNGEFLGVALENGVPAVDQTKYHFYWYEGQNTLVKLTDANGDVIDNPTLTGVKGGGLMYTLEVVSKDQDCSATFASPVPDLPIIPLVTLDSVNNTNCASLAPIGSVTATIFMGGTETANYASFSYNWDKGSSMTGVDPAPNSTTRTLSSQPAGYYALQVTDIATTCRSVPVNIEVLDVLNLPDAEMDATPSTNCTVPANAIVPNGRAEVTSIDGNPLPGDGTFTFQWFVGLDETTPVSPAQTGSVLANRQGLATYSVKITNTTNGCTSLTPVQIADNSVIPVVTLAPADNNICDQTLTVPLTSFNGSVTPTITNQGGNPLSDYTFSWFNQEFGSNAVAGAWTQLDSGVYTLRVTHTATGCQSSLASAQVQNITQFPVIDSEAIASTNCQPAMTGNGRVRVNEVNSVVVDGTSPYRFRWFEGQTTGGVLVASAFESTSTLQGSATAYYTVEVIDNSNGCANTQTVLLPDNSALPIIELAQSPNTKCDDFNGEASIINVTYKGANITNAGNLAYKWYNGTGVNPANERPETTTALTGLQNNLFVSATVTMTDLGCTSDFEAIEIQNGIVLPTLTTSVTGSQNCTDVTPAGAPDGSASVVAAPADTYNFAWYDGNTVGAAGSEFSTTSGITGVQGAADAYFTVLVTSQTTLCSNNATVLVPDNSQIPVLSPLSAINNPNCSVFPDGTANAPAGSVTFNGVTYRGAAVAAPYTGYTFIWSGPDAPAPGANLSSLTSKGAGLYSLQIQHDVSKCLSDPVQATILDALVYPDIDNVVTEQTSCDVAVPNGSITATVGGGTAGFAFAWFNGVGTGGTVVAETSEGVIQGLASDDYTVRVHNTTTACTSTESLFLPDLLTYPTLTWQNVMPLTRCDVPDGEATPAVANASASFTVFTVITGEDGTYPTDPSSVIATGASQNNLTAIANLMPGYVTGVVRNELTKCVSSVETVEIENNINQVEYQITGHASASNCNPGSPGWVGGGINVSITGGVGPGFEYLWYKASPVNADPDINFYNNPPDMGGAAVVNINTTNPNLGRPNGTAPDNNPGFVAGTYTLVVKDLGNGCGTYAIDNIPLSTSPGITITENPNTNCVNPNGSITVTLSTIAPGPYELNLYSGNSSAGTLIESDAGPTPSLSVPDLLNGNYYVELVDNTLESGVLINAACPIGEGAFIERKAYSPVVKLTLNEPNTSCDPANSGDGQVDVQIVPHSLNPPANTYEIFAASPLPINFSQVDNLAANSVTTLTGFGPSTYTISVRDEVSLCEAEGTISIPDQPVVPQILSVTTTPETFCFPLSNGEINIIAVSPGAVNEYNYVWSDDNQQSNVLFGPNASSVYNATLTGWKTGTVDGQGNGDHTYYVRGYKTVGLGVGCPTPIVMAVVNDQHVVPQLQLSSTPDTSCEGTGEGSVTVLASTASPGPAIANATYTYVFNGASTSGNVGAVGVPYTNIGDGVYPVVATNEVNGCQTSSSITVKEFTYPLLIIDSDINDQYLCANDGAADITNISFDSGVPVPYDPADYSFKWFKAPAGSPGTFDENNPLLDGSSNIIDGKLLTVGINPGQYPDMEAGTYYVIAKRLDTSTPGAGCPTPPYRVDVMDRHINPSVQLTPFTDTSCDGSGEGSIEVRISSDITPGTLNIPPVPASFTYEYTWVQPVPINGANQNNGNGDGSDGDDDNPQGLTAGLYEMTVRNLYTNCTISGQTTITLNETPVFIADVDSLNQTVCGPGPNGLIRVTQVDTQYPSGLRNAEPLGDFEYTWTDPDGIITVSADEEFTDRPAGTYFVVAKRISSTNNGPGIGCESAPRRVDILDRTFLPQVSLTPFSDTGCSDDAIYFEGSIRIDADENVLSAGNGATYSYFWEAADPANASAVLGTTTSGDGNANMQLGLRDDTYSVTVTNNFTQCFVQATTTITKSMVPVIIVSASPTPKMICHPDGSAEVDQILVAGNGDANYNNFDFVWYEAEFNDNNIVLSGQNESLINTTEFPDFTRNSLIYFVKAVRRTDAVNADLTPAIGRGCESLPVSVMIPDLSVDPVLSFNVIQNSHCNMTLSNATVTALANEPDGTPDTYAFEWVLGGVTLPNVTNVQTPAMDGVYTVTATNDLTGCDITNTIEVIRDLNLSKPNIVQVDGRSATDCFPTGEAEVISVTIGGAQTLPGSDARFEYEWFNEDPNNPANNPIANETSHLYQNVLPETYFVRLVDTNTECPSGPTQVTVDKCLDCFVDVDIAQTMKQINCMTGTNDYSGQLSAVALNHLNDDSNVSPGNFVFTWYNALDTVGTVYNDNDQHILSNLADGDYAVRVIDVQTNCRGKEYYIIQDDAELYRPQLLLTTVAREHCEDPDGALLIQQVAKLENYPFSPPSYTITVTENVVNTTIPVTQQNLSWFAADLDTVNAYTVLLVDDNTGCDVTQSIMIPSNLNYPVPAITVDNPLQACDDAMANGQFDATADGGQTLGYDFTWFGGVWSKANEPAPATAFVSPMAQSNKLIGVGRGQDPNLQFTVKVTNEITQCYSYLTATMPESLVYPINVKAELIQHDMHCTEDEGWVRASVPDANGDPLTTGYNYYWFDQRPSDTTPAGLETAIDGQVPTDENYNQLPAGTYYVVIEDIYTGCPAMASAEVKEILEIPQLVFKTTASFCDDVPTIHDSGRGTGTIELSLEPTSIVSDDITWFNLDAQQVGTGNFVAELLPGRYSAVVVTNKMCVAEGETIVPTEILSYNLVTQNADGKNDRFVVDCLSYFPNNNVKIFNRSGVLVYNADYYDNINTFFDGIGKNGIYMSGNVLPVGTYFYIIDKGDGSKPRTGYLELVR